MTLKEELEVLRGEPIEVFTGDPKDIPFIETSDSEGLCKHPVVSVHMITYNHEPYIRQAIEGVMMQKTDFEFELIIGEDCSQDKTREICFEYQKKYPDKIRVLWWHENVSKFGGNWRRGFVHCRGEFIAICEGDDYWIDPLKLQKQVDAMRKHPNVGFCFANGRIHRQSTSEEIAWNEKGVFAPGALAGREFLLKHIFGVHHDQGKWPTATFLLTASTMMRRSTFERATQKFDIFTWRLRLGDSVLWLALASTGDCYYLADEVSVYNQVSCGLMSRCGDAVFRDGMVARAYFASRSLCREMDEFPNAELCQVYNLILSNSVFPAGEKKIRRRILDLGKILRIRRVLWNYRLFPVTLMMLAFNGPCTGFRRRYMGNILDLHADPKWIVKAYCELGVLYRNDFAHSFFCRVLKCVSHATGRRLSFHF